MVDNFKYVPLYKFRVHFNIRASTDLDAADAAEAMDIIRTNQWGTTYLFQTCEYGDNAIEILSADRVTEQDEEESEE